MDLSEQRREYRRGRLRRADLDASPFVQFRRWLDEALASGAPDPTAMCLATVDERGRPWQRIVLLKHFDERGFVFYTNLGSRKAREIAHNPQVSLLFPWLHLDRQVIVGGTAERISSAEALRYFLSRPRESQLAAWASPQSRPLPSRALLEATFARMRERFRAGQIPMPDFWGGFRVVAREFEFWQGGEHRLHDRFRYQRVDGGWQIDRLAP
ncbi:MAG: pyridoxine/pyridoxamine 5'-phosphate oxidase [Porticoccaceae bacterium]|nr:MAG: pyridoxine/pyridoxamine 5'-phosphate oxidase [Porticoccaceae bacterium]